MKQIMDSVEYAKTVCQIFKKSVYILKIVLLLIFACLSEQNSVERLLFS
jgi:predicted transglutaminase-like protease